MIDVRRHNEGRRYRFASGKHIKSLVQSHGIAYMRETLFSPTQEMLDAYRQQEDWPGYELAYDQLIQDRDMIMVWEHLAGGFLRPCLLCAEWSPRRCHRRLLAEHVAGLSGVPVVHLRK